MSTKTNEPILVQHPRTGRWVNVRPMLEITLVDSVESFEDVAHACREVSRLMIEHANPDGAGFSELQMAFTTLHRLADAFGNMQQYSDKPKS